MIPTIPEICSLSKPLRRNCMLFKAGLKLSCFQVLGTEVSDFQLQIFWVSIEISNILKWLLCLINDQIWPCKGLQYNNIQEQWEWIALVCPMFCRESRWPETISCYHFFVTRFRLIVYFIILKHRSKYKFFQSENRSPADIIKPATFKSRDKASIGVSRSLVFQIKCKRLRVSEEVLPFT